jgi:hypothetical protein
MEVGALKWASRAVLALALLVSGVIRSLGHTRMIALLDSMPRVCPVRFWLGLKCGFCGMTHAFVHLVFGEWAAATRENRLAIPVFGILGLSLVWASFFKGLPLDERKAKIATLISVAVLLVYAIVRNVVGE